MDKEPVGVGSHRDETKERSRDLFRPLRRKRKNRPSQNRRNQRPALEKRGGEVMGYCQRCRNALVESFTNTWNVVHGLYLGIAIGLLLLWSGSTSLREGSTWGQQWSASLRWAGITLLFVTIPLIGEATVKSILRFLGTVLGGTIAVLSWLTLPRSWYMSLIGGLVVFVTYVVGLTVKKVQYGTTLCGVTYLIVCMAGLGQENANLQILKVATTRIFGITLGIAIGLLISIIHPASAAEKIHINIAISLEKLAKVVQLALEHVHPEDTIQVPMNQEKIQVVSEALDDIRARILKAQNMVPAARMEVGVCRILKHKMYLPWCFPKRPRSGKVPVREVTSLLKLLRRACYVIDMLTESTNVDNDSFLRYAIQIVQGEDLMAELVNECCKTFQLLADKFRKYDSCTNEHLAKFDAAARQFLENSFAMRRKLIRAECYRVVVDASDGTAKLTADDLGKRILAHDKDATPTGRLHYYELQVAMEALLSLLPSIMEMGSKVNQLWPFSNFTAHGVQLSEGDGNLKDNKSKQDVVEASIP